MAVRKIECSECNTIYRIDESKIPNKVVRSKCKKCGGVIVINGTNESKAPVATHPVSAGMKLCPKCKSEVEKNSYGCDNCGILFDNYEKLQVQKKGLKIENEKNAAIGKKKVKAKPKLNFLSTKIVVLSLLGVACVVVGALLYFNSSTKKLERLAENCEGILDGFELQAELTELRASNCEKLFSIQGKKAAATSICLGYLESLEWYSDARTKIQENECVLTSKQIKWVKRVDEQMHSTQRELEFTDVWDNK